MSNVPGQSNWKLDKLASKVRLALDSVLVASTMSCKLRKGNNLDIRYTFILSVEWVLRSELTLKKGWVNLANEGHSQYC